MKKLLCTLLALTWACLCFAGCGSNTKANTTKAKQTKQVQAVKTLTPRVGVQSGYDTKFEQLNDDGRCELTIDNSKNAEPVYLRLWSISPAEPVRAIYVSAYGSFTMEDITPGEYELRYKYLYQEKEAERGTKSQKFSLKQIETESGVRYSVSKITLYKVPSGNFSTSGIPASEV